MLAMSSSRQPLLDFICYQFMLIYLASANSTTNFRQRTIMIIARSRKWTLTILRPASALSCALNIQSAFPWYYLQNWPPSPNTIKFLPTAGSYSSEVTHLLSSRRSSHITEVRICLACCVYDLTISQPLSPRGPATCPLTHHRPGQHSDSECRIHKSSFTLLSHLYCLSVSFDKKTCIVFLSTVHNLQNSVRSTASWMKNVSSY